MSEPIDFDADALAQAEERSAKLLAMLLWGKERDENLRTLREREKAELARLRSDDWIETAVKRIYALVRHDGQPGNTRVLIEEIIRAARDGELIE